ncbi:MAG: hypothetical protein J6A61_02260 [Clostridia bacterium]|nr:hypothetical protein [Clostridia bacterium]
MLHLIVKLKSVVLVILICEFLKELLAAEKFKRYLQFAVSLFLFAFFLSAFLHTDFSLPQFSETVAFQPEDNLLKEQYETQIATAVSKELTKNGFSYQNVTVTLSDCYEIETIRIVSDADPEIFESLWKGDIPYEVVHPSFEISAP